MSVDTSSGRKAYMRVIRRRLTRLLLVGSYRTTRQSLGIPVKRIAILAQEKLGDAILLTPLLKKLSQDDPGRVIDLLVFGDNASFFEKLGFVGNIYKVKKHPWRSFRAIRRNRYDVVFNPKDHPSYSYLLWTVLVPSRYRAGIAHPSHQGFYDLELQIDFKTHVVEKNCAVLPKIGIDTDPESLRPVIPDRPLRSDIDSFVRCVKAEGCVGVNISAGQASRELPLATWRAVLEKLGERSCILSAPDRYKEKAELERVASVLASPETRDIYEVASIVRACRILITPDTSLVHIASAVQTPLVGLYRQTALHSTRFSPYWVTHHIVRSTTDHLGDIPPECIVEAARALQKELSES